MTKQKEKLLLKALAMIEVLADAGSSVSVTPGDWISISDTSDTGFWGVYNGIRTALRLKKITPKNDPLAADFTRTSKYPTA